MLELGLVSYVTVLAQPPWSLSLSGTRNAFNPASLPGTSSKHWLGDRIS